MDQNPAPKPGRGRARAPLRGRGMTAPTDFPISSSAAVDFRGLVINSPGFAAAAYVSPEGSEMGASTIAPSELSSSRGSEADISSICDSDEVSSIRSGDEHLDLNRSMESRASSQLPATGVIKTINPEFNKFGTEGTPVRVVTNYYLMNKTSTFSLYQYRVDFSPVEDNTNIKKMLLRQHEPRLGPYIFDGSMLYKTTVVGNDMSSLESRKQTGGQAFQITIRLVGQVNPEDAMYLQFYNIVMRKAMTLLGMEEMGRHLYDRHAAILFKDDKIQLWPGFITAIRNHMAGTLLCVEVTHKVLRDSSVYDVMRQLKRPGMSAPDYEKAVRAEIEDTIVMTHYNRRTYKVNNIDFKTTPASSFLCQDGQLKSYVDYYQERYNITIPQELMHQPMLISTPKKKDLNKGVTGDIYLIPSLCNPTGLNDDMRKNFALMKKLSAHLHMDPGARKRKLDEFMRKLKETPSIQKEFASWDVDFDPTALESEGRVFPREKIIVGPEDRGPVDVDDKGDWTRTLKGRHVLRPEHLQEWVIFCPRNDTTAVTSFIGSLKRMGGDLGINVNNPKEIIGYDVARFDDTVLKKARDNHGDGINFVFFILPNNQLRRYADVKNYCSLTWGVASQCFLAKNMNSKTLNSICTKVMIQVTAKLGGIPWSIKIPFKKLMVLGFDVYHCSARKGESAGGLVATSSPSLTSYISVVSFHKDKSELSNNICTDMAVCLEEYRKNNGFLPDRIIMYRDGVGEGQVSFVLEHEVEQVKLAIRDTYSANEEAAPKLSFIIVTKKINSRAFLIGRRGYENLNVGTVMDRTFTLPERYDFFLVSQDVRQGTVSPTNYNVVYDQSDLSADKMQRFSYKMCHLYFNWSGTVAVPAPCQYAHKLAYLTGVAINEKVQPGLYSKLWYL